MEAALRSTADSLRFRLLRIPHAIAVVVMALTFHTKDPYGVGYALNIIFPRPLPLDRVRGSAPHVEVGPDLGGGGP